MKAKVEFLWYKVGEEIKAIDYPSIDVWVKNGFVIDDNSVPKEEVKVEEPVAPIEPVVEDKESVLDKVKSVVEDALDDGKLNKSNKKKKNKK